MKTTEEQRTELRRLADARSVLKWPELIDLLDDFAALEAENAQLMQKRDEFYSTLKLAVEDKEQLEAENERLKEDSYFTLYKSAKERVFTVEQENAALKQQVARLTAPVQTRYEGEIVPEGVSCTETGIAYYVRVRKKDRFYLFRITKEPFLLTTTELEKEVRA